MSTSIDFPEEPREGEKLTAVWGAKVARALRKLAWTSSPSIEVSITTRGTYGRVVGARGSGASIARTLLVEDASTEEATQVSVSVGRIANLPLTIDDVELGATPAPRLAITETGLVYIKAIFEAAGEPTDDVQSFEIHAGAEVPADTETAGYKVLAEVDLEDGAISRVAPVAWNFSEIQRCGPTTYLWGGFGGS